MNLSHTKKWCHFLGPPCRHARCAHFVYGTAIYQYQRTYCTQDDRQFSTSI